MLKVTGMPYFRIEIQVGYKDRNKLNKLGTERWSSFLCDES